MVRKSHETSKVKENDTMSLERKTEQKMKDGGKMEREHIQPEHPKSSAPWVARGEDTPGAEFIYGIAQSSRLFVGYVWGKDATLEAQDEKFLIGHPPTGILGHPTYGGLFVPTLRCSGMKSKS